MLRVRGGRRQGVIRLPWLRFDARHGVAFGASYERGATYTGVDRCRGEADADRWSGSSAFYC